MLDNPLKLDRTQNAAPGHYAGRWTGSQLQMTLDIAESEGAVEDAGQVVCSGT